MPYQVSNRFCFSSLTFWTHRTGRRCYRYCSPLGWCWGCLIWWYELWCCLLQKPDSVTGSVCDSAVLRKDKELSWQLTSGTRIWLTSACTVWHLSIYHDPACRSPPSLDVHSFAQLTTDSWCCLVHPQSHWVRELSAHQAQRLGTWNYLFTFDTLTWHSAHSSGGWRMKTVLFDWVSSLCRTTVSV